MKSILLSIALASLAPSLFAAEPLKEKIDVLDLGQLEHEGETTAAASPNSAKP